MSKYFLHVTVLLTNNCKYGIVYTSLFRKRSISVEMLDDVITFLGLKARSVNPFNVFKRLKATYAMPVAKVLSPMSTTALSNVHP